MPPMITPTRHPAHPGPTTATARGFTLIEVMIVVAIVAILGAIAMPAYTSYLRRGDQSEAFTNLSAARIAMEQYYQDNRNYGSSGTTCGATLPTGTYFTYTCATASSAQAYTLTATGKTSTRVNGYVYTTNESGAKATTTFAGSAVTKSCWLSKGNEC